MYTGQRDWEFLLAEILPLSASTLHKEWAVLCACASPQATSGDIKTLLTPVLNWDTLLNLADRHGVQGVLALKLGQIAFAGVPTDTREKLQSRMRGQHLFTLSLTAELFRILQDFANAGIDTLLVKGPLTSLLAYGDPAVRNYSDLDLLLPQRDIAVAAQHMLALGFHSDVPVSVIRAGKVPGEYVFRRPGTSCIVEFHTERTFRYYPKLMPIDELFARKRMVVLDGREVPALSLEDDFLFGCIHGTKDFWERLLWVSDVAAIMARHPELEWEKLRRFAKDVRAERMFHVAIQAASSLLGVKLPTALAKEIQLDRTSQSLSHSILAGLPDAAAAPPSLPARAMYRLKMAGGGLFGAVFLMRLSLSPTHEDWAQGPDAHTSWWWDSLRRPFRLFRKYGSNQ